MPKKTRRIAIVLLMLLISACGSGSGGGSSQTDCRFSQESVFSPVERAAAACVDGVADGFGCSNVDLLSALTFCRAANDVWAWTDPDSGTEYALLGIESGTVFVDIDDPEYPVVVGFMASYSSNSTSRDIKTLGNYAYVVSEARNHGLQIFDLTRLRGSPSGATFFADAHFAGFSDAHNLAINEDTETAYVVGSGKCAGGLYILDLSVRTAPVLVGCYFADGYTHDTQCVIYEGLDADYVGREICFNSNEDTLTIVDVTDKSFPVLIRRASYAGAAYTHQGWLTEDHRHFLLNDESDELLAGHNSRTYVWDLSDLDTASVTSSHDGQTQSTDHNLYIRADHVYEANYTGGLQILRSGDLDAGELAEIAYFDTVPESDGPGFSGAWTAYPFLASGTIVVSDTRRGLFLLRADLTAVPECDDGLDNDGNGAIDFPVDGGCDSLLDTQE
jgi:choice-of-anchor B domain-containing protein